MKCINCGKENITPGNQAAVDPFLDMLFNGNATICKECEETGKDFLTRDLTFVYRDGSTRTIKKQK